MLIRLEMTKPVATVEATMASAFKGEKKRKVRGNLGLKGARESAPNGGACGEKAWGKQTTHPRR